MDLYLDTTIRHFTKSKTPRRRKNWVGELWKLDTANIALHLVLAQKSELSLNDLDFSHKPFTEVFLTSYVVLYCVKSLH